MDNEIKINIEEEITNINVEQNDITIELNQEPDFVLNLEKQGPQGERGENGADGENATIEIGTVEYGEDISVTNSGTPTHAVLDFVFPLEGGGEDGILGIEAWYKTTYGIIDTGDFLIINLVNTSDIIVPAGFVLKIPNKTTKVTIASDINYSVTSSSNFTLFYVDGGSLLEAGEVYYQTEEPSYNSIENYQAWFNPEGNVWSFRSNDTGNVWIVEEATPLADIFISNGNITRIDYVGYRLLNNQLWKNSGSGLEIGDIGIAPLGIDETLGKRRYLNGQVIIQEQYQAFANKVKSAIVLYPNLACSEQDWQATATLSAFGQCGKFVVDDVAGTIRLPKITGFIQGLADLASLGSLVEAGLPNITGTCNTANEGELSGAITSSYISVYGQLMANSGPGYRIIGIDASQSNPIYSNSDTVQPESIRYPYFIQIATGSDVEVDIVNEIELNNPFVLLEGKYFETPVYNISWLQSNQSFTGSSALQPSAYNALLIEQNANIEVGTTVNNYTKRGLSVKLISEAYTDFDFVLDTENQTFRCPTRLATTNRYLVEKKEPTSDDPTWYNLYSDGFCEQGGVSIGSGSWGTVQVTLLKEYRDENYSLTTGSIAVLGDFTSTGTGNIRGYSKCYYADKTSSSFKVSSYNEISWQACGYVSETVSEDLTDKLYFYVGETVQNANLINAGRIEEKLSDCITRDDCKAYIVERYRNGTSWYRVWSDGYIEQGGYIGGQLDSTNLTITYLKPFKATVLEYNIHNTRGNGNDVYAFQIGVIGDPELSSMTVRTVCNTTSNYIWSVRGY